MADATPSKAPSGRKRPGGAVLGVLPFFVYTGAFLLLPTAIVVVGAFLDGDSRPTLSNLRGLTSPAVLTATWQSLVLSVVTAIGGAVIGGVLAYAVSTASEGSAMRRMVTSLCGVLAQFGGVALAFAFMATFGLSGFLTVQLTRMGLDTGGGLWLYQWDKGLMLVYLYFQIPLMVIVFLPAVDGLRPQWREASETLGGTTWTYWRRVAGPILFPSFAGSLLLLFTNAFSAYATAAALVSQGSPILPLQIAGSLSSETVLGQENVGKAMALLMIVIVAVVMALYAVLDRRASRWLPR